MQTLEHHFTKAYTIVVFGLALNFVPLSGLDYLEMMPGDIGDSRLNNYFLENIYLYLSGLSDSLWHLGFFHPFRYIVGFSDNLFGSSPVYVAFRFLGFESDTSFQYWFLFGYFVNFYAAYWTLRKLGGSAIAASIGALIFAFALPTSAHISHVQLHYRFGVPLTLFFLIGYLETKNINKLIIAGGWLVWQFYCGIYIGFFLAAASIFSIFGFLVFQKLSKKQRIFQSIISFYHHFLNETPRTKRWFFTLALIYLLSMILLFYPYLHVSIQYGSARSWGEIASMLPRIESYFLADASELWGAYSQYLGTNIPMRHEHQMFVGVFPLALLIFGAVIGYKTGVRSAYIVMAGILIGFMVITLSIFGGSLWILFYNLPLASAIRAMTRFDQVLLLPVAYFCMLAVDRIIKDKDILKRVLLATLIISALLVEMSLVTTNTSEKKQWRERLAAKELLVPDNISPDKILFFEQDATQPFFAEDIDAMWVALNRNMKTLNGYSGNWPPSFQAQFHGDCSEFPNRVLSYMKYENISLNEQNFYQLREKFALIGFANCNKNIDLKDAISSTEDDVYTVEEIQNISYELLSIDEDEEKTYVAVRIRNSGDKTFYVKPQNEKRLKLSWRNSNKDLTTNDNWDPRIEIPGNIPAFGYIDVSIPILRSAHGLLQVSMVQEGKFWAHDAGVSPITIPLN